MQYRSRFLILCATLVFWLAAGHLAKAAPLSADDAWERWRPSAEITTLEVDHAPWRALLQAYLDSNHPSGIKVIIIALQTVLPDDQELSSAYTTRFAMWLYDFKVNQCTAVIIFIIIDTCRKQGHFII